MSRRLYPRLSEVKEIINSFSSEFPVSELFIWFTDDVAYNKNTKTDGSKFVYVAYCEEDGVGSQNGQDEDYFEFMVNEILIAISKSPFPEQTKKIINDRITNEFT